MVPELFPKQLGHLHEETAGSPNFTAWSKLSHPQCASRAPHSFRLPERFQFSWKCWQTALRDSLIPQRSFTLNFPSLNIYARTNILYIYTKKKGSFSKRLCQETSEVDEMAPSAFLGHSFKILIWLPWWLTFSKVVHYLPNRKHVNSPIMMIHGFKNRNMFKCSVECSGRNEINTCHASYSWNIKGRSIIYCAPCMQMYLALIIL